MQKIVGVVRNAVAVSVRAGLLLSVVGNAQTYSVADLGALGDGAMVATGLNSAGAICGYAADAAQGIRAWRYVPGQGLLELDSFGGSETRAMGINAAGRVTGFARDAAGRAHGFVCDGTALTDLGAPSAGVEVQAQQINGTGQVAGFLTSDGGDRAFLFTAPGLFFDPGFLASSPEPASAAAFALNDAGQIAGSASAFGGFRHAVLTSVLGTWDDLGTLGGDESVALAINGAGQAVGTASAVTTDSHAFLFTSGVGMLDLGTLGGYTSTAYGLDESASVVGAAETPGRELHAFLWSAADGMRDLNDRIPANAGWILQEARGINASGVIVGNGMFQGRSRAFILTPFSGLDTSAPVAVVQSQNITNAIAGAHLFEVVFWDNTAVLASSITTNCVRVTGPGGFNQVARLLDPAPSQDALWVRASFFVNPDGGVWNGTNNGVYSVVIEPGSVRDSVGNSMPGGTIGSFTVAAETRPVVGISSFEVAVMNVPTEYALTARSSFPYEAGDVFEFTVDWNDDGTEVQVVRGVSGMKLAHAYPDIGVHRVRLSAVDVHGVSTGDVRVSLVVGNPLDRPGWVSGPALPANRRLAVGANAGGTLVCLGGLPLKGSRLQAVGLPAGAAGFVEGPRLNAATEGLGAGVDALGRLLVYGGIEPGRGIPNLNGYVYGIQTGVGASIAPKRVAVHGFAFCADSTRRLYSFGGATGPGISVGSTAVERYDGTVNTWTQLAPMPAPRIGASATPDGLGHLLVIGGLDPATGQETASVLEYDIAGDSWTQRGDAPGSSLGIASGRVAVLGADGWVYLIGGMVGNQVPVPDVWMLEPLRGLWMPGPRLSTPRGGPAVALGDDGSLYAMGGDGPVNGGGGGGNNGLSTVEKLDTAGLRKPQIVSSPAAQVQAGSSFSYLVIASGNPQPVYSLVRGPDGMQLDPRSGVVSWVAGVGETGSRTAVVRAESSAGVAEQRFVIEITPVPGDVTPPTAPTVFFPAFRTATNITFTWNEGTDDIGVVGYNLYNLVGSRSRHWALIASGVTNRSLIHSASAFAPQFAVAAVDAAGNVSPFKTASANSLTLPVITRVHPGEPSAVILGSAFLHTVTASATLSPVFDQIRGPEGMTLTRVAGPNPLQDYAVVQWQPTAANLGTNVFTVFATNANTTGGSATFSVVVLPPGTDLVPPTSVARMTASAISFDECRLDWTPAGDNIGIAAYHLVATHFGIPENQVLAANVPGTDLGTVLTGLLPGAGYTVSITPSDGAGNIGPSTSIFLTTLPKPEILLRLSISADSGAASLDWNPPGAPWKVIVESAESPAAPDWQPVDSAEGWPNVLSHLALPSPGTMRFFRVRTILSPP